MTTIYLMRHSEPFKKNLGINDTHEELLFSNIKSPLSIDGEKFAETLSLTEEELQNIDVVWSSNYVRTMSTAKWFTCRNNLKVNVTDKLGERKHGIKSWDELPPDFELRQYRDENYKIGNGESRKETTDRIYSFICELLENYKDKRILIVGHSTAFMFLLMKWCNVEYEGEYSFNDKVFFDGKWNYCETFKLEFNNKDLINIENISQ